MALQNDVRGWIMACVSGVGMLALRPPEYNAGCAELL